MDPDSAPDPQHWRGDIRNVFLSLVFFWSLNYSIFQPRSSEIKIGTVISSLKRHSCLIRVNKKFMEEGNGMTFQLITLSLED